MKDFAQSGWEWREVHPLPVSPHEDRTAILELLIPLLVAGLAWGAGKPLVAGIVAVLAFVLLLLKFTARAVYDVIGALLSTGAKRLARWMSYAALTVTYVAIFAPVALVGRLLRRDPLECRWRPSGRSYWVDLPQRDPLRLFDRPFLIETRHVDAATNGRKIVRISRFIYHAALTAFLANLALGYVARNVLDYQASRLDDRSHVEVYAGERWAGDYFKEFTQSFVNVYTPFVHWVRKDYTGQYINVKNGHRRTYQSSIDSKAAPRLFTFGASTMWGTGSRDDFTIPSYLVKLAERDGTPLAAENFAQSGFVNWQNVITLAEQCADGNVPDLVIFYEGAGDVSARLQSPSIRRVHSNFPQWQEWIERHDDPHRWLTTNSLVHILGRMFGYGYQARRASQAARSSDPDRVQRLAHEVVMLYSDQAALVRKLADSYGFKAWFFWQPVSATKKHPSPLERTFTNESDYLRQLADVYRAASAEIRSRDFAVDLSTSFDDEDRTIYIDWAHYSDSGNEIIAKKMYSVIRPILASTSLTTNAGTR